MSLECLTAALKVDGLTPTRKLILVILANYADEAGTCYPSHKHIAQIVGLKDHKGVQKIIKEFESIGLLEIQPRFTDHGGRTSNRYHLKLHPYRADHPTPTVLVTPNTKDETKDDKYSDAFEEFWAVYPRKVNKYAAFKKFQRLKEKELSEIQNAVRNFAQCCLDNQTEEQFIPHAATWLNNKRFEEHKNKPIKPIPSKNFIAG
tara:strand:- start:22514 stop:23125 length:612 start_codon:yes stop_codon:yes gene_type:complete